MRENEKAEVFNAAIEVLVAQAVERTNPRNPGGYAATTRADLRERHRSTARRLYDEYGELTGDQLAILLAAEDAPAPSEPEPPSSTAALPAVTAAELEASRGAGTPKERARQHVAAIKASLASVEKLPAPDESPVSTRGSVR